MIRYECDKCGRSLRANDPSRYIVKIEVFAAAGPVDLGSETGADTRSQIDAVLERLRQADPDEIEDQTYRAFKFDLCDACRKLLIAQPLGPKP